MVAMMPVADSFLPDARLEVEVSFKEPFERHGRRARLPAPRASSEGTAREQRGTRSAGPSLRDRGENAVGGSHRGRSVWRTLRNPGAGSVPTTASRVRL